MHGSAFQLSFIILNLISKKRKQTAIIVNLTASKLNNNTITNIPHASYIVEHLLLSIQVHK